jgi:hypothetical protein
MTGYLIFLLVAATVTVASYALDRLYAEILPARFLYEAIRIPGIALHELAHVAGCLVTGAKIRAIVLFSKDGGSVTYSGPKVPVLGTVVISTAPLVLLPLLLSLLTWVFSSFLGCSLGITIPETGSGDAPFQLAAAITGLFYENLVARFNGWFLVYLYLCVSIILSLAPSRQDFANATAGIALLAAAGLLVIGSGYAPAVSLMGKVLGLMAYPFMLGFLFEMIVAVVSLPLVVIYGIRNG